MEELSKILGDIKASTDEAVRMLDNIGVIEQATLARGYSHLIALRPENTAYRSQLRRSLSLLADHAQCEGHPALAVTLLSISAEIVSGPIPYCSWVKRRPS